MVRQQLENAGADSFRINVAKILADTSDFNRACRSFISLTCPLVNSGVIKSYPPRPAKILPDGIRASIIISPASSHFQHRRTCLAHRTWPSLSTGIDIEFALQICACRARKGKEPSLRCLHQPLGTIAYPIPFETAGYQAATLPFRLIRSPRSRNVSHSTVRLVGSFIFGDSRFGQLSATRSSALPSSIATRRRGTPRR